MIVFFKGNTFRIVRGAVCLLWRAPVCAPRRGGRPVEVQVGHRQQAAIENLGDPQRESTDHISHGVPFTLLTWRFTDAALLAARRAWTSYDHGGRGRRSRHRCWRPSGLPANRMCGYLL